MITLLWAALAGALAVGLEFLFKRGWGWVDHWYLFIPAGILLNYLIYRLVTAGGGTTWIVAIGAFTLATVLFRAALSQWVIHEPVAHGNLAAAGLLIVAQVVGRVWR